MIPTGRISVGDFVFQASIILGPDIFTYRVEPSDENPDPSWFTLPLSDMAAIQWDAFPFEPADQPDEIEFLRAFIEHLSPEELEAAIEAKIGEDGMHRQGEWVKAALLDMVPK